MKNFNGFTLAEVLITLGVIGVVAAMTMPTLIQKQNEKATVTKLKKVYTVLSQAYLMIQKDYGEPMGWLQTNDNSEIGNLFAKYMKISKNCGTGKGCFSPDDIKGLDGTTHASHNSRSEMSKLITADGYSVSFRIHNKNCNDIRGTNKQLENVCGWVTVDINGNKKPNTFGKDIFEFNINKYGIYPYGTEFEKQGFPFETFCLPSSGLGRGNSCTAWVLYNENMDYLHCNDLSWSGKHKCE